jgi:hypothetical protein
MYHNLTKEEQIKIRKYAYNVSGKECLLLQE